MIPDGSKATVAILILCAGSGVIGYNMAPRSVSIDKPIVPKSVRTTSERGERLEVEPLKRDRSNSSTDYLERGSRPEQPAKRNELELRSLGSQDVNEGITRRRYVRHSYFQLTNLSNRTVKIEEWWVNHRRGTPLCSMNSGVESAFSAEAAKLKQETGRDISNLFPSQLPTLHPGDFLTLDFSEEQCGGVFRVDVRTDQRTEFWTVNRN